MLKFGIEPSSIAWTPITRGPGCYLEEDYPLQMPSEVIDLVIQGVAGPIDARKYNSIRYRNQLSSSFMGAGWVAGDLEWSDRSARMLAIELEAPR